MKAKVISFGTGVMEACVFYYLKNQYKIMFLTDNDYEARIIPRGSVL